MITKEQLKQQLMDMGISHKDTVVIHSSMKSIGDVDGGADTVIEAFREYLYDGLFIVPTHTWANVNDKQPVFDRKHTPSCIGLIPNLMLKTNDAIRSMHPTHSIAAIGPDAVSFTEGEQFCTTPTPLSGCWGRLYKRQAKILLIGVGQERNTYLHAVEEELNIPNRLAPLPTKLEVRDNNTFISTIDFHPHKHPTLTNMSTRFVKFEKPFHYLGALKYGTFGCAPVQICDAVLCHDIMEMLWKKADYDLTADFTEVPTSWYTK